MVNDTIGVYQLVFCACIKYRGMDIQRQISGSVAIGTVHLGIVVRKCMEKYRPSHCTCKKKKKE